MARLYQGNLAGAADFFAVCAKASERTAQLGRGAAAHLALTYALRGDLPAATQWHADAERRPAPTFAVAGFASVLPLTSAIIAAREGRYDDALGVLDQHAHKFDASLSARWARFVRALRAFVLDRMVPVRDAGTVDSVLAALRPAAPGEFAMWIAEWPEMRTFLQLKGLVATASPAPGQSTSTSV